jgi:hypothetical protein
MSEFAPDAAAPNAVLAAPAVDDPVPPSATARSVVSVRDAAATAPASEMVTVLF